MDSPEVQEAVLGVIADVEAAHWEEAAEAEQRLLHWRPDSRFPNQTLQSSLAQKLSRGSRAARGLEPPPPELRCPPASARRVVVDIAQCAGNLQAHRGVRVTDELLGHDGVGGALSSP
ncbi:MAG: hypothetical protein JWR58_3824 [Pseudonocardia sp.]|nr:hypothetical protein [Pseudonocardia sp.]